MAESVGTSKTFTFPIDEIIDFALEGIGGEHVSGKEAKLARTALNLVLIDLQNQGAAPMSSIETVSVALVSGSSEGYVLSADILNVMNNAVIRVSSSSGKTDLNIGRMSYDEWLSIPTKTQTTGRPTQFMVERQRDNLKLNVWPVPDAGKYDFFAWTLRTTATVDASHQLIDLPRPYLSAVTKGLRYYMADLRGVDLNERLYLKQEYFETLQRALDFDRDRVNFSVYPELPRVL